MIVQHFHTVFGKTKNETENVVIERHKGISAKWELFIICGISTDSATYKFLVSPSFVDFLYVTQDDIHLRMAVGYNGRNTVITTTNMKTITVR